MKENNTVKIHHESILGRSFGNSLSSNNLRAIQPYYLVNQFYRDNIFVLQSLNRDLSESRLNATCGNNFECRHDYIIRISPTASSSTNTQLNDLSQAREILSK